MGERIELFPDLSFLVVASLVNTHVAEFRIYNVAGFMDDERPLFERRGSRTFDPTESIDEADPFATGRVKWDGCSDWHFDECDRVNIHGCTRHDVTRIGDVLGKCWDMAAEMIEAWSGDV